MEIDIKPDVVHDVVGTFCPVPVAETARVMKTMEIGRVLELVADDPVWWRTYPHGAKPQVRSFWECMKRAVNTTFSSKR